MSQQSAPETPQEDQGPDATPVVNSRDLLGEHRELVILHGRERYRLLLTRSNKLILTK
jgi:hemin uptake protein HemP